MDFLDPAKKRQHKIRLMIGYCLIAIMVLTLTYLLFLQTYGFDYDRHTGKIIQNGLVYLSSKPVSAEVYANGERKGNTSTKLTIPSGHYNFVLKSPGYRDWTENINLEGGSVEQLTYSLLIPEKLTSADVQTYDKSPTFASESIDRHWLLVQKPASFDDFDIFDLSKPTAAPKAISIPEVLLTEANGTHTLKVIEWASNNRHVLMEHKYKSGGPEYIILDTQNPAQSFNINQRYEITASSMALRDKKFDQYYAYTAKTKTLLAINADTDQVTTLLRDVIQFKGYGPNIILYTSDVSKVANHYAVNIWDGQKSYLMHNYPAESKYLLDMTVYSGQSYVAVSPVSTNKLYIFKNPLPVMRSGRVPNPFIALKITDPQFISFSANARFVMAQNKTNFAGYDFEKNLWHYYRLKSDVPLTTKATWIDGYHLVMNIDNKLNIFDFNGNNQQVLVNSQTGFGGYFNSNYNSLYTVAASETNPKKFAVKRTPMVVPR